jgi:hypothetical protein
MHSGGDEEREGVISKHNHFDLGGVSAQGLLNDYTSGCTYRMARYKRLPSLTSSIDVVAWSFGGLAVVINPPASCKIAILAAISLHFLSDFRLLAEILSVVSPFPTPSFPPYVK